MIYENQHVLPYIYLKTTYFASQFWYISFLFMVYFFIMSFSSPILVSALFQNLISFLVQISWFYLNQLTILWRIHFSLFLSNFEILMIKNFIIIKKKNRKISVVRSTALCYSVLSFPSSFEPSLSYKLLCEYAVVLFFFFFFWETWPKVWAIIKKLENKYKKKN